MAVDFRNPLERALLKIEAGVVKEILSGVPPPNTPSTIKRKKSSKTLIDKGKMLQHVDHRITGDGADLKGSVGFYDEENAEKARINEEGTKDGRIPPRPFLLPGFDKTAEGAAEDMAEEIFAQVEKELGW